MTAHAASEANVQELEGRLKNARSGVAEEASELRRERELLDKS